MQSKTSMSAGTSIEAEWRKYLKSGKEYRALIKLPLIFIYAQNYSYLKLEQ